MESKSTKKSATTTDANRATSRKPRSPKTALRPSLREGKQPTYDVHLPAGLVERVVATGMTRTQLVNEALRRVGSGTIEVPEKVRVHVQVDPGDFELASAVALERKKPLRPMVEAACEQILDEGWMPEK